MDKANALDALTALSQATRLDVFRLLVRAGPAGMQAGRIAGELGVLQNTLSTHLGILSNAGLVRRERQGRMIRYRADYDAMRALLVFLLEDCCQGDRAICAPVLQSIAC
jgi:DNA-binding transcriptional ArsR family regulator